MKNKRLGLLITLVGVTVSCSFGPSQQETPTTNPNRVHYVMKAGVSESELQGTPWINSNLPGMTNKVKQPSLKDDFYASVNYDNLVNNNPGPFDISGLNVRDQLDSILTKSEESPNGDFLNRVYSLLPDGAMEDVRTYINSISAANLNSSQELLYYDNSFINLSLQSDGSYCFVYNDGYVDGNYGLQTMFFFNQYYDYYREATANLKNHLFNAFGVEMSDEAYNAAVNVECVLTNKAYQASGSYSYITYTVGGTGSFGFLDNALTELGFANGDTLKTTNVTKSVLTTIQNYINISSSYLTSLGNAMKLRLMFEYRFLLTPELYRPISKDVASTELFSTEYDLTGQDDLTTKREMMKHAFSSILEKAYINLYCDEDTQNTVTGVINEILNGYKSLADKVSWIDSTTREGLLRKLNNMSYASCYSEKIKNYPLLEESGLASLNLFGCYNRYRYYMCQLVLKKQMETDYFWASMPSYTVNAFYSPYNNEFVILNGLLSGGFIGDSYEETLAGLGLVIGHEISHSIDSNGAEYDEYGQRNNWWSSNSKNQFQTKVQKMVDYYNGIYLYNRQKANGNKLNTEATADMGGMRVCLEIASKISGFDYDKFFRRFAYIWHCQAYDDAGVEKMLNDEHPFDYLRCNVTLAQFDEFVDTYDIKEGDGMYIAPSDRVAIW